MGVHKAEFSIAAPDAIGQISTKLNPFAEDGTERRQARRSKSKRRSQARRGGIQLRQADVILSGSRAVDAFVRVPCLTDSVVRHVRNRTERQRAGNILEPVTAGEAL